MAYISRTIRLAFDGTDDNYPLLGDDIWVAVNNPMIMPMSALRPDVDIELNPDGTPKDPNAAVRATMEICAKLIVDWNVYDPRDLSDNPTPLPMPATVETIELLPVVIVQAISELAGKALNRK